MDSLERIAMLIDADNTQVGKIGAVIRQISTKGRIVVKRAYGNWKKDALRPWEEQIKTLAIDAKQQFDYVSGKNASDMAVVIDAMDMLYRDIYDCFVLDNKKDAIYYHGTAPAATFPLDDASNSGTGGDGASGG